MSSFTWSFTINREKFKPENLHAYQELLRTIKPIYEDILAREYNNSDVNIFFHDSKSPPSDNIFASFQFKCNRHLAFQDTNIWYLLWNPLDNENTDKLSGSFCVNCAPIYFLKISDEILQRLQNEFPECVEYSYDEDEIRVIDERESSEDNLSVESDNEAFFTKTSTVKTKGVNEYCDIDCGSCLECIYGMQIPDEEYYY